MTKVFQSKGSLISESFSLWHEKQLPNHAPEHYVFRWIMVRGVICHHFLGDLSQSEKLSEIKPPLEGNENSDNVAF